MAVQYFAQHGDQPGEKLPPLDVGGIIMILMLSRSPILCFKLVIVALLLMIEGWKFPHSLRVSSGSGESGGTRWWSGGA